MAALTIMVFSKEFSVGNRILDSEHKKLHDIINTIAASIKARDVVALSAGFELLENCLHAYFVAEENIAQAVGFDFNQHRVAHQDLMYKFQSLKNELTAKNLVFSEHEEASYIHTLCRHLKLHVLLESAPLELVLSTHFYDLKPD